MQTKDAKETRGKKLTASEVVITTATIEVKILQIGNRQFTLSVYDQLLEEPIIDPETGKLCGTPWGWVNRHTDCKEISKLNVEHLHIIWQKGNELRKAIACLPWNVPRYCAHPDEVPKMIACSYFRKREDRRKLATLWLTARVLAGERKPFNGANRLVPFNIYGYQFEVEIDSTAWFALSSPTQPWARQQMVNDLRATVGTTKAEEVLPLLAREAEALGQLIVAWEKSYKKLERLDQLFIAV